MSIGNLRLHGLLVLGMDISGPIARNVESLGIAVTKTSMGDIGGAGHPKIISIVTIKNILSTTEHRPWAMPKGDWKFYQEWNNAIFLHWQVSLSELRKWVPEALEIDLFEGGAWVSVVAFTMENIRPRNWPAFSPVSDFDEVNIRTYVRSGGKTGVYFLSIEGGKKMSCTIARGISQLPYRFSIIKRLSQQYTVHNRQRQDRLNIEYAVGDPLRIKTPLDKWLTERYALFQDTEQGMNEYEIHHVEWPIDTLILKQLELDYPIMKSLIRDSPDLVHYSKGVQVLAWGKKKS